MAIRKLVLQGGGGGGGGAVVWLNTAWVNVYQPDGTPLTVTHEPTGVSVTSTALNNGLTWSTETRTCDLGSPHRVHRHFYFPEDGDPEVTLCSGVPDPVTRARAGAFR